MVTEMIAPRGVGQDGPEGLTELEGLRRKVFLDRYALKDANGAPLELYPEQMWRRVARGIASAEPDEARSTLWTDRFYELLSDFKFVPGGRILSGAGTEHEVTYYNCYVVGIGEDPLDPQAPKRPQLDPEPGRHAFFTALGEMTDIMARSGGVGMNLSSLAPAGTPIAAPGRGRAGGARPMVALSIGHPDIETLLDQRDHPSLAHLDLGVIVPRDFDTALAAGADWGLDWPGMPSRSVAARALWDRMHEAGERPIQILRPGARTLALEDSRESIVEGAREAALALFGGRSLVVDFSHLRPKGAYIKTVNGTSSGPVAWMYLYDALARADDGASAGERGVIWFGEIASTITGKTIQQGGSRRGALMVMLDDDHPDVEAFVAAKRIDPVSGRPVMLEHANLSVCISDAFMAAVRADLPWDLQWQGRVVRTIRARALWEQICASAWATAEPGVVFMQRAREQSPMWYRENIRCTNPCVTGETLISTDTGLYRADYLAAQGTPVRVASPGQDGVSFQQASHVFPTGTKPVYRLETEEGYGLRLTGDHRVLTTDGWVEARHLRPGQRILLQNGIGGCGTEGSLEEGRVLGWLIGDGHLTNRGGGQQAAVLSFWGEDRALVPMFADYANRLAGTGRQIGAVAVAERDETRLRSARLAARLNIDAQDKLVVPTRVLRGTRDMQAGFLQALFSADGTVGGTQVKGVSVRLASSSASLLADVQRLLLNLGIASRIYRNRRTAGSTILPDGKGGTKGYATLAQHELAIARANLASFAERVGFLPGRKAERLGAGLSGYRRAFNAEDFTATFAALIPAGVEPVYDLTEPEAHLFVANGVVIHNCGEQPIPAGAVCNLGALNLACYVDDEGRLDEAALGRDAATATRFLDNVIDATPYFSELHIAMQREGTRRIGLGTMGLADALIKMRVGYGSPESLAAIDRIYGIVRDSSYRASVALAEEKGACGFFERGPYLDGPFIRTLPEGVRAGIAEHGVRNGVLLTQAPTGTTSLLAGVSSGIEPVFDFAIRRTDRLGEHIIYHPLYQAWKDAHPGDADPAWFRSARDLSPEEHVRVQARVQRYTDSSISKCVTGETLVLGARGLLPIADLHAGEAPDSSRPLGMRVASLGGAQMASHFYFGGLRPTIAVRLADGRRVIGTPNHRLYCAGPDGLGWKRLDELAEGDQVAIKINTQIFGEDVSLRGFVPSPSTNGQEKRLRVPASMNPMLAHFLGSWCAEGGVGHYTIRITNNEHPVLERLRQESVDLFGIDGSIAPAGANDALTLSITSKWLCEFLAFTGCTTGAAAKRIPWSILQSSRESVLAFLSGLYLDGYVTPAKIAIALASKGLIEELQVVLDNLGVQSWISVKHNKVYDRDYYELNARGREAQRLALLLSFDERHKIERATALLARSFGPSKSDLVPIEAREAVFWATSSDVSRTVRYRHHAYSQRLTGARQLSWSGLRRLANDPEVPLTSALREVVEENLHFRRVLAVADAGEREVYDLTVPATEAFIANGIVNHNTANAPHDHTAADVMRLYDMAYELGCKGVTYYRDGSRDAVLTSASEPKKGSEPAPVAGPAALPAFDAEQSPLPNSTPATLPAPSTPRLALGAQLPGELVASTLAPAPATPAIPATVKPRPQMVFGYTRRIKAPEGTANITINSDESGPMEVFINVGRAGSDIAALAEAMGRLMSLCLRLPSPMPPDERMELVATQLHGIGGSRSIGFGAERVLSLPDAVAQALTWHLEQGMSRRLPALPAAPLLPLYADPEPTQLSLTLFPQPGKGNGQVVATGNICPQCGSTSAYVFEEGCKKCHNCGYSEC